MAKRKRRRACGLGSSAQVHRKQLDDLAKRAQHMAAVGLKQVEAGHCAMALSSALRTSALLGAYQSGVEHGQTSVGTSGNLANNAYFELKDRFRSRCTRP